VTPLVLVHGFMGGGAQWAEQVAGFSTDREVIAVDLPGFGANAHLPVINTIGGFADWVIAQLRSKGVDRYHLMGHSMGGMIVQEMARRDADRIDHLILYATGSVGILPGRFETIAQSKERALADGAQETARRIAATWFLERENAPGYEACAEIACHSSIEAIVAGLDAMQVWSGEDYLPRIKHKTRIIWGDCDRTYAWAQINLLWTTIPKAQLAVVPDCAHAVHMEKSLIFNSLVLDFLPD
jgi:2-hydroxy-6-oxonona-2,4-dienedioate hydrolase